MALPFEVGDELLHRVLVILGGLMALALLARLALRIVRGSLEDPTRVYHASRIVRRTAGTIAILLVLLLLSPDVRGLITVLTVVGAGLAIALREALLSIAGWMRIGLISPYRIGERIEIGGVTGDVIDIRMLRTTLMEIRGWVDADQSTGRIVHIPNSWLFEHALYNFSRGFNFVWNEVSFTLTFRSDWSAARDILLGLAEESAAIVSQQAQKELRDMSREFLIHYSVLTPFVYVRVVDNGIRLTLRYLCDVRKRRGTEHALTVSILEAWRAHGGIEFAVPAIHVTTPDTPQFASPDRGPANTPD